MRITPPLAVLCALLVSSPGFTAEGEGGKHSITVLSDPFHIDRIYKSMQGPSSTRPVTLLEVSAPELLWVVGYRVEVVDQAGVAPISQEFMCHSNLDMNVATHRQLLGLVRNSTPRLFTLSQGQGSIEFPRGFGIPTMSNEPLLMNNQVLNHNLAAANLDVRQRVTFDFFRDRELKAPMKPLFPANGFVTVLLQGKDGVFNVDAPSETQKHASCLPGEDSSNGNILYQDTYGRRFSGHWLVPPGRQEAHTLVTNQLRIPYDTTIHFIGVHVHPFCESLELRDLTTGQSVFKSRTRSVTKGIGLENVETLSSEEGLPVYKDHDYELVSVYNNTSAKNQDAMATFGLYLLDKEFKRPGTGGAK